MAIRKELTLVLENKPGAAARVFQGLADDRINILAMQLEHTGLLRLVVDNPLHASELMRERKIKVDQRDVLYTVMPNDPGALGRAARLLADAGVNIEYGRRRHRRAGCDESFCGGRNLTAARQKQEASRAHSRLSEARRRLFS
jgi:hypothetical protein